MNKEVSPGNKYDILPEEVNIEWMSRLQITKELLAQHPNLQDYLIGQFNRWKNIEQRCEVGSDEYLYVAHMTELLQQKMTELSTFGDNQAPAISMIIMP